MRAPSRRGFGSVLIDRSIPFDLGGESSIQYNLEGVSAQFRIPQRYVSVRGQESAPAPADVALLQEPAVDYAGKRALVVEDQMLIALELEQILEDAGLVVAATLSSPRETLAYLSGNDLPDVAILDVNLGDDTSEQIAEFLMARQVPFMFATGYGDGGGISEIFSDIPVVRKPFSADAILSQLSKLF